jgi:hypothetical protein
MLLRKRVKGEIYPVVVVVVGGRVDKRGSFARALEMQRYELSKTGRGAGQELG